MADRKAMYLVRPNERNRRGYSNIFAVATDIAPGGGYAYDQERTVNPGQGVLVLETDDAGITSGTVYVVPVPGAGEMTAPNVQARPGDIVRLTCSPSDSAFQAGTTFVATLDGSLVDATYPLRARLAALEAQR